MVRKVIKEGALSAATGAVSVFDPVSGIVASVCRDTYKAVADMRAQKFFAKIQQAVLNEPDNSERVEKLIEKLKNSESLQESLFDFTQSAVKTRSELAITMLAIAYCELAHDNEEPSRFLHQACISLPSVRDDDLFIFEVLTDVDKNIQEVNSQSPKMDASSNPRFLIDDDFRKYLEQEIQSEYPHIKEVIMFLNNRGMVEATTVPLYGGSGFAYIVTDFSLRYRELLLKAKSLVEHQS